MKIITWNINSIRLRLPLLRRLASELAPDVICLQEIKTPEAHFPFSEVSDMGFVHIALSGMKGYNGVAILSRLPLMEISVREWCGKKDARHIAATLPDGTRLHNLYVPAGGDVPDAGENDKFAHKLQFLDEMAEWGAEEKRHPRRILVGDLNVAPLPEDVWSHRQMLPVVSHTPMETERLVAAQKAGGWIDLMRCFTQPEQKLYTWWSYRAHDWRASNRGRRLDHIWCSPEVAENARFCMPVPEPRSWDRPSDHVPVMAEFSLP